jgi:predicted metal-dependent hydrolase
MQARLPQIDFSRSNALWLPAVPEFAHQMNAGSLLLPYLEPYLIKVMKLARPKLAEVAPELLDDVDAFNRQEANHFKVHAEYNRLMRSQYPGLEAFEAEIRSDFQRFLSDESLGWNLAYCEGFESAGLVQSEFFLQEIDDLLADADPAVTELWRWHLAEEFEHRSVAHDVLKALHPGYVPRLRGSHLFMRHLMGFSGRVRRHLLAVDRLRGNSDDTAAIRRTTRELRRRQLRFLLPRMARILRPGYDPRRRKTPGSLRSRLAPYEV